MENARCWNPSVYDPVKPVHGYVVNEATIEKVHQCVRMGLGCTASAPC